MIKILIAKLRILILTVAMPFVKWMGKVEMPFITKNAIKSLYPILDVINTFDLVLISTRGHLSNAFNFGRYKHIAIYIGKNNGVPTIIEAVGKGVLKRPLAEMLAHTDNVTVVRINETTDPANSLNAMNWLLEQVGKPYDFLFDLSGENKFANFYCAELAYYTMVKAFPNMQFELREVWGTQTVLPDDFYNAAEKGKTKIIYDSREHVNVQL